MKKKKKGKLGGEKIRRGITFDVTYRVDSGERGDFGHGSTLIQRLNRGQPSTVGLTVARNQRIPARNALVIITEKLDTVPHCHSRASAFYPLSWKWRRLLLSHAQESRM